MTSHRQTDSWNCDNAPPTADVNHRQYSAIQGRLSPLTPWSKFPLPFTFPSPSSPLPPHGAFAQSFGVDAPGAIVIVPAQLYDVRRVFD